MRRKSIALRAPNQLRKDLSEPDRVEICNTIRWALQIHHLLDRAAWPNALKTLHNLIPQRNRFCEARSADKCTWPKLERALLIGKNTWKTTRSRRAVAEAISTNNGNYNNNTDHFIRFICTCATDGGSTVISGDTFVFPFLAIGAIAMLAVPGYFALHRDAGSDMQMLDSTEIDRNVWCDLSQIWWSCLKSNWY